MKNNLIDGISKETKAKDTKKMCHKKVFLNLKTINTMQLENEINHIEKIKSDIYSLKEDHKKFIKKHKLILKTAKILS